MARRAAADEVDALEPFKIEGLNISIPRHLGPMLGENPLAERIAFDLPSTGPSGPLEAKIKSSNPAEQRAEG
ncbi:MAG TPA: hypothetical protein VLA89_12765 [Gemmatimonadales bacterium]|nr:hypothetical protein [Gemmatimonadales bacterium]